MHALTVVAIAAAAVVALGVLVVAFLRPGPRRRGIEWLAATSFFVVLVSIMLNGLRRAIATDSEAGMIAFGFLSFMFASGFVVSTLRTIRVLTGRVSESGSSATH